MCSTQEQCNDLAQPPARGSSDQTAPRSNNGPEAMDGLPKPALSRERKGWSHLGPWWPEIAWCAGAIALLAGLVIFLQHYDRKDAPKWASNIPINAVVAIIATVCRAMTVVPIAEGLSQLKWNSFARTRRPLEDILVFDQASRGPWGSLMLLSRVRGR